MRRMNSALLDYVPTRVQRLFGYKSSPDTDDVVRGAIAGAVGGMVGMVAMAGLQRVCMGVVNVAGRFGHENGNGAAHADTGELPPAEPRSYHQQNSPSERLVETVCREVIHRPASRRTMKIGGSAVHLAFGATVGAIYGAAAELEPRVTAGEGTLFGTAVFLAADEIALPLTGLAQPPLQTPLRRHAYALVSHFAFGAATEFTRRFIREQL
jgi:uncharacterized membrane protein YagU involved in acid resistance